jgi:putative ABC transport system permease protein
VFETARADLGVLLFTAGLSLASALLVGIIPAIKGTVFAPAAALTARGGSGGGSRWRHVMIAAEAAFSVVLLCAAGLLCQNLWRIVSSPRGFSSENVTVIQLRLPHVREQALNPTPMRAYSEYLEKLAAVPGVDSAAVVNGAPIHGAVQTVFSIEGLPGDTASRTRQTAMWQRVSPDYFRTLRIPLHAGRTFRGVDTLSGPAVVIVNQEFVRRFLPNRDPIGQRIGSGRQLTIVGVVGDVRIAGLKTAPEPQVYVSSLQGYDPNAQLVVRSSLPRPELLTRAKQAIRSVYADQAIFNAMSLDEVISRSVATPRFQAILIGAFALLALMMAASGLYGVISCLVTQRTSEIAIRMALGANRSRVVKAIVGQTAAWVLGGLAVGMGLGAATSTLVRRLSLSADSGDPLTYAAIALVYLAVTLFACLAPVRRATRLDPATALRAD